VRRTEAEKKRRRNRTDERKIQIKGEKERN
jgi:hypothetical protein